MLRFLLKSAFRAAERSYNTPERKGARGEFLVHNAFATGLDETDYRVLSDLILPLGSSTTQIDHVVLSRFGIFVVETKNMSGWIFGSSEQRTWTQVLKGGKKRRFQNPLHQNYAHVKAVKAALNVDERAVFNLVVFVGDAEPKTAMPDSVAWSMHELGRIIGSRRQRLYSTTEVQGFERRLNQTVFEQTPSVKADHLRNLEMRGELKTTRTVNSETSSQDEPACPRCGAPMAKRTNRKTGECFLGCTRFPKCRGTQALS